MAKNNYGCICDICGYYSKYTNLFYSLKLPTFHSETNNFIQRMDYCLNCYKDLKHLLAKHYNIDWENKYAKE